MYRASPLVIVWLVAACTDSGPTAPTTPDFQVAITCVASVTAQTVTCDSPRPAPPPGMQLEVTLGGQNTYVLLTSSATTYNSGTQIFQTDVTVKNLIVQPMNSADGLTADTGGVKVFFTSPMPNVIGGSGTVKVGNPTGTGTFLGSSEPYYRYSVGSILSSGATSESKTWQFDCPNTVTQFRFAVLVTTKLPADQSVLLWTAIIPLNTQILRSVRIQTFGTVPIPTTKGWAVGDNGTILQFDGFSWTAVNPGFSITGNLYGLDATGAGAVYAVGDGGLIVHSADTGKTWGTLTSPVSSALFSVAHVSGSSGHHVFIAGAGGVILHATDGVTFTQQTSNTTDSLFITGGFTDTNFFAGGQAGTALRWNNTSWSSVTLGNTATVHTGGGMADNMGVPTNIWLVGTGGTVLTSTSPVGASGTWSAMTTHTTNDLFGFTGGGATDLFAVGASGTIQHHNGLAWSPMASGTSATLRDMTFNFSFTSGAIEYWVVGSGGTILHGTR